MTPPTEDKAALRALLRARRAAHVATLAAARPAHEAALVRRVEHHLARATLLAAFVPVEDEIDPLPILHVAHMRGIATALPCVVRGSDDLVFRRWSPGDPLVPGPMKLRQPAPDAPACAPDLIVTPLLGFDRALGRIGQGKGYYDRAFATHPSARRIGVAWSSQEVAAIPMDMWDVALHGIATEREWIGG